MGIDIVLELGLDMDRGVVLRERHVDEEYSGSSLSPKQKGRSEEF